MAETSPHAIELIAINKSFGAVQANRDVNLDIGQTLKVDAWQPDGSARVNYRGAAWSVRYAGTGEPQPGEHEIVEIVGSQLRVAPRAR